MTTLQGNKFYEILHPQGVQNDDARKRVAFTLAEVLITLGIIGVVAAMTLPNLINSYQKRAAISGLKYAYSTFSQAVKRSVEDNGAVATWELSYSDMAPKYIFPYVETIEVLKKRRIVIL